MEKVKMSIEMTERVERCIDCYFFQPSPSGSHGYCRRMPPVFTSTDEAGRPKFFSPVVSPHAWCGEFEDMD
jgi:hypothetical protein